jgi:hypothetical protein
LSKLGWLMSSTALWWVDFRLGDKVGFKQSWMIFILIEMLKNYLLLFYGNNF